MDSADIHSNILKILDKEHTVDAAVPICSPVRDFFYNKTVFLTGPTGFLGHLFLEKLLRIGVRCVYVLMRPKRNKSSHERLVEMCSGPVFRHLHVTNANFLDSVQIINGNLEKPNLGIESIDILTKLKEEIEIVIHAAADVRFNEPLYNLILCNLYGTRELLELSKQMEKLQIFLYLSTAFSHCKKASNEDIAEVFYPPPMNADILINYVQTYTTESDRERLRIISPNLIRPWPNNYTFSKALSESIVQRYGIFFPIAVIRPTIIISTYADPIAAWSNSYGGMNGVTAGIGSGLLRNLFWKNIELNIICADFVTNGSLAIAWHTCKEYNKTIFEPKIYHINRASDKMLFFDETVKYLVNCGREIVCPTNSVWYPVCQKTYFQWHDSLLTLFYQVIPSAIMDIFIKSSKYKLMPLARKICAMSEVIQFFNHNNFNFANENLQMVLDRMTDYDRQYFICDPKVVNWKEYYMVFALGARQYLLQNPLNDFKAARNRMDWLKLTHYTIKSIGIIIVIAFLIFLLL